MKTITLAHGNGGRRMHELIEVFRSKFSNRILDEMTDAAEIRIQKKRIAFSTDSFVVKPLFFPGGDIGKLAVCGTVNDISMKGAKPLFISLALILEEGLEFSTLEKIAASIKKTSMEAGVRVVTGDVKVVERGAADGIFINTSGIGVIDDPRGGTGSRARKGDAIVINGAIAEHGMAILNVRENLGFRSRIKSDCRDLNREARRCRKASRSISVMRDPTRGGLATALGEIASASDLGIEIYEKEVPIKRSVRKLCDVLGFDPLYVANEGKFICFVKGADAEKVRRAMGAEARIIGKVISGHKREVRVRTCLGSSRILPMLETDQLPRIC